jgi:hypothetical protein
MSGLYNMVLGDGHEGDRGSLVLTLLSVPPDDRMWFVGRFRDAWIEAEPDGPPILVIYTRNGGGNRDDQHEAIAAMQQHPLYLRDRDDTFDSTYATFYFTCPTDPPSGLSDEDWTPLRTALNDNADPPVDTDQRWLDAINQLGKMTR